MFVCICSGVTDKDIVDCAKDGCSFKEMLNKLDVCKDCKICVKEIVNLYKKHSSLVKAIDN